MAKRKRNRSVTPYRTKKRRRPTKNTTPFLKANSFRLIPVRVPHPVDGVKPKRVARSRNFKGRLTTPKLKTKRYHGEKVRIVDFGRPERELGGVELVKYTRRGRTTVARKPLPPKERSVLGRFHSPTRDVKRRIRGRKEQKQADLIIKHWKKLPSFSSSWDIYNSQTGAEFKQAMAKEIETIMTVAKIRKNLGLMK